jgi:hypothetical protein
MIDLSDDEYEAFDFSEFTADDFKAIDAQIVKQSESGPQVSIEVEPAHETSTPELPTKPLKDWSTNNPLTQFRKTGVLSVTDLTALAWYGCTDGR